jgi:hypothetical protein
MGITSASLETLTDERIDTLVSILTTKGVVWDTEPIEYF